MSLLTIFRRSRLLALLLTAFVLLSACASLDARRPAPTWTPLPSTPTPEPSGRGAGGTLRLLYWETPTILNPHLSASNKEVEASRVTYEPLASFDSNGELVPFLAEEIPSLENGGVAEDGTTVIWTLRDDVRWSDGMPFTAEDVQFTFEYITSPDVASPSAASYEAVESVEVLDEHSVRIRFKEPTPAWVLPFVGGRGVILPRHMFEDYIGTNAREAPANIIPVGTGPYRVVSFEPQETLFLGTELVETKKIVYEPNPYYRNPDKPYFSRVELRGGGTPLEAARLVLEEGTVDFAYNLTVPFEELAEMEEGGEGHVVTSFGAFVEMVELNHTDPYRATPEGEFSSLKYPHPFFADKRVRQAFAHAIDREAIADLYGATGRPTSNILVSPPTYYSPHTPFYEYDLDRARELLDEAGWVDSDGDGVRDKHGRKLSVLFQTGATPVRQQTLNIIQSSLEEIGVEVELKFIDISIYYSGDPNNPNTADRFQADMQEWDITSVSPDPGSHMRNWTGDRIPQKSNSWSAGLNSARWRNPTYEELFAQAATELDPEKRQQIFIRMNDKLVKDVVVIPLVHLADVSGISNTIEGFEPTPWDADTWNIQDWSRTSL